MKTNPRRHKRSRTKLNSSPTLSENVCFSRETKFSVDFCTTMSRFLCCCATTDSSKEDDSVRSSDPKKRASKGKKPPKTNEHGRATEEISSPYYTPQQLEEVKKLYLSIDPSELFLREKEIKEKVREIIAKGDKGVPVKARKRKAKKNRKSRHKKGSDNENESQHSYPLRTRFRRNAIPQTPRKRGTRKENSRC